MNNIESKLDKLLSKNHIFIKKEMLKTNKLKKIKYWLKSYLSSKACLNYYIFLPLWIFSSINLFDCIKNPPDFIGVMAILFMCIGLIYFLVRTIDISTDNNGFSKMFFLSKSNKEDFFNCLRDENLSLDTYKLLCENLSKEELLTFARNKKNITYNDIGVNSWYVDRMINYEKNEKDKELFNAKNEKLTNFLEVMHNELNKK